MGGEDICCLSSVLDTLLGVLLLYTIVFVLSPSLSCQSTTGMTVQIYDLNFDLKPLVLWTSLLVHGHLLWAKIVWVMFGYTCIRYHILPALAINL